MPPSPAPARVLLAFDPALHGGPPRLDLSAVVRIGDELWLASDEGGRVERLSLGLGGAYDRHASFCVADYLPLDAESGAELDIEGLDYADGYLWVVGSHSARRKAPKPDESPKRQLRRLARVEPSGVRQLLARIPLVRATDGASWELAARSPDVSLPAGERRAARLTGGRRRGALVQALRDDEHLAPFLDLPGKDNGFDVEGLAVGRRATFLGLRGPVLRGHAVILAVRLEAGGAPDALALGAIGRGGRRYRKHLLDLRGLGVRELVLDGDDLLILAGPTMQLDGRALVLRWRDAVHAEDDGVVDRAELDVMVELPSDADSDEAGEHPEGMTLTRTADGRPALLVVYDGPQARRRHGTAAVDADIFPLA